MSPEQCLESNSDRVYPYRTEEFFKPSLPSEVTELLGWQGRQAVEAVQKVKIVEHDSGKPGPLVIVTCGMHGEETKGDFPTTAEMLDLLLTSHQLQAGKVLIIPNLNANGCLPENKTRFVFSDESDHEMNLNDIFHYYKAGTWDEFVGLEHAVNKVWAPKTSVYGWLVMNYLVNQSETQKRKWQDDTYLIDVHREESLPYVLLDRMYEDKRTLEKLVNSVGLLELPAFLEYKEWKKIGYNTALTPVAGNFGFLGFTIEEGRTHFPDQFASEYVSSALLIFIRKLGMLYPPDEHWSNFETAFQKLLAEHSLLAETHELWNEQNASGKVLSHRDVAPVILDEWGNKIKNERVVKAFLNFGNWDGIVRIEYDDDLRARRGTGESVALGKMYPGIKSEFEGTNQNQHYYQLLIPELAEDNYVVSAQELPDSSPSEETVYYALRRGDRNKVLNLEIVSLKDIEKGDFLKPEEIRRLLKKGYKIKFNNLEIVCACPEQLWMKEVHDGKLRLRPRSDRKQREIERYSKP